MTPPGRSPFGDDPPFREPLVGRLAVATMRDDAFGIELRIAVEGLPEQRAGAARLVGTLRGPTCSVATTLPVTATLLPVGGPVPTARAVLTEPAHWSPELPNLYRLEARLDDGDDSFGGWIGVRRLGIRGRSFRLDGRRFVLRGETATPPASLDSFRRRHRAVVLDAAVLDASLLDRADREGVFITVRFDADEAERLAIATARHPSAAFVVAADAVAAARFVEHRPASGPLVGLAVEGSAAPEPVPPGVAFLEVRLGPAAEAAHDRWFTDPSPLPLVAAAPTDFGPAVDPCDRLQATLARAAVERLGTVLPWDWAGYVTSSR